MNQNEIHQCNICNKQLKDNPDKGTPDYYDHLYRQRRLCPKHYWKEHPIFSRLRILMRNGDQPRSIQRNKDTESITKQQAYADLVRLLSEYLPAIKIKITN